MKSIKLQELHLENFKGHKSLTITPNGQDVDIYGDNATGKSTVYDAVTWLLFGTDSAGNGEKSINIKPLDANGEVADHEAETSVEAVFLVNNESVSLRRTLKEIWTTKRGCAEAVFDGNTSEYYVDGVPVKANAFKATIKDIIPEDLFRLLTDVYQFPQKLDWKKRREKLFEMAGTMSDDDVMATDARWEPLKNAMGKLVIEQFRAKCQAERKAMMGARNEIPARINECTKSIEILEGMDFAKARETVDVLNGRLEVLRADLAKIENNTAITEKKAELYKAQADLRELEMENKAHRASQEAAVNPRVRQNLIKRISDTGKRADEYAVRQEVHRGDIGRIEKEIGFQRDNWNRINNSTFTAKACPTCGQDLPAEQIKAAKERFEADKQARLQETQKTAKYYIDMKKAAEANLEDAKAEEAKMRAEVKELEEQLSKMDVNAVMVEDLPDYQERHTGIQQKIENLHRELRTLNLDSDIAANSIRGEIGSIQIQIRGQMEIIGKESVLGYTRQRIEELRRDAANAAEKLAEAERYLFLIDEYGRYKAKFVEDSVNSLFHLCNWRLFREQANGGIEDRCDATYNGVPYTDLNSGCKINVGIDIINALSRAYGVSVPLIIDNAESVTQLEAVNTQIIRLIVSEQDKALRVVYHG